MKRIPLVVLVLAASALAQEPTVNKKFLALSVAAVGTTFADSYTTLWSTQNWNARKAGVCNVESVSPWLYGTHPTAPRAYGVAAAKSVGAVGLSYLLRKRRSRLWSVPLIALAGSSGYGVASNMRTCN
jgi:hypothetical protein